MLHKPIHTQNKARSKAHSKAWLLYVCLLTMLAGCSQCNKVVEPASELSKLPAATQTGAGTFGCMVNGKAWTPAGRRSFLGPSNPSLNYDPFFGDIAIIGSIYYQPANGSTPTDGISITAQNTVFNVGTYSSTNSNVVFIYLDKEGNEYFSNTEKASNCQLIINKLDKTNNIIAGTFSFTLEKKDTGKKVTVTDGRFDLKYL